MTIAPGEETDVSADAEVEVELLTVPPAASAPERHAGIGTDPAARASDASMTGDGPRWSIAALAGLGVAIACSLFVFTQMRPDLLFANSTPSGGDMGAHVWGPAFLRDNLLSSGQLAGWTKDWYAGFPAYQFYMVVPSLAIIAVNAGLPPLFGIPLAIGLVALVWVLTAESENKNKFRIASVIVALLLLSVPYGIAFKLVSVAGLVSFPVSAWLMGRLARAPEPIPAFLSIGALIFLFDTNFTIYGGNIASTLAGEFAFSISLSLCLVAFGMAARGMETGQWRARSAVIISLVALTHLIPVFFAVVGLIMLVVLGRDLPRLWPVAAALSLALIPVAYGAGAVEGGASFLSQTSLVVLAVLAAVVVFAAVIVAEDEVRRRFSWLLVTGPVAAMLAAFWLIPFYLREPFFNDMGWERLNEIGPSMLTVPMKLALPVAAVGAIAAVAMKERIGLLFAALAMVAAAGVANVGEGPLWNARLLPFYYLSVYLLAAVGVGFVMRFAAIALSEDYASPDRRVIVAASAVGLIAGIIAVGMPLRVLPGGVDGADGTYRWLAFTSHARSFVPSWTAWNYSGYEAKPSYREYSDVVSAMDQVGDVNGCGRAMWEYSKELDRYGTPMALMLLPHWTDGCIGSMEGLYFESSATTPFHFLNQSMLSQAPSRAQRDLPYQNFDINRGISQLQVMGVRYYMAQTDESIAAAREHADLSEVADAPPFVVFEVAATDLVQGLSTEPVVVTGRTEEQVGLEAGRFDIGWLGQAVTYYNDPASFLAIPAEDGPGEWQRVESLLPSDGVEVPTATVSDIDVDNSWISFTVDQIGTPVLVKASYFPNWDVEGADGPWRAGPNLMVVVPTETSVKLSYGRTFVDWLGIFVTLLGIAGLVGLAALDRRRWFAFESGQVWGEERTGDEGDLSALLRKSATPTGASGNGETTTGHNTPLSGSTANGTLVEAMDPAGAHDSAPPDDPGGATDAAAPRHAAPPDDAPAVRDAAPPDDSAAPEDPAGPDDAPAPDGAAGAKGGAESIDGAAVNDEAGEAQDSDDAKTGFDTRFSTEVGREKPSSP